MTASSSSFSGPSRLSPSSSSTQRGFLKVPPLSAACTTTSVGFLLEQLFS